MRKIFVFILMFYFISFGDLKEKFVAKINFSGFGSMKYSEVSFYKNQLKKDHSVIKFKAKGFFGNLAAKLLSNDGKETIYDLDNKIIYNIDLADQTYTESSISEVDYSLLDNGNKIEKDESSNKKKSYKVLREIFKVIDKKEDKKINKFDTHHYNIYYVREVQDMETGKIRTDSMFIDLYNSKDLDLFKKISTEKKKFYIPYYKLLGIKYEEQDYYDQIFGSNWLGYLNSVNRKERTESIKYSKNMEELKKIKGYPIVIDGVFFYKGDDEKPESDDRGNIGGFIGLLNKVAKDKDNNKGEYKKIFSYRYELLDVSFDNIDGNVFKVPANFDKM